MTPSTRNEQIDGDRRAEREREEGEIPVLLKANLDGWSETWNRLWEYPDLPERLRAAGVDGVEVALSLDGDAGRDDRTLETLVEWSDPWHDAGLTVHPHPYTDGSANPANFRPGAFEEPRRSFRRMATCAERLAERSGSPVALTYHAAEDAGEELVPRETLLERSMAFFSMVDDELASIDQPVSVVSETQLPTRGSEDVIRIGDVPEEVLATVGENTRVGACWDTGHYSLAVERRDAPSVPGPEFVSAVRHMHVHDVVDDRDHRPPTPESSRVARYVGLAAATGQLSSVTLEYDYGEAFEGEAEAQELLRHVERTAALVREWARSGK